MSFSSILLLPEVAIDKIFSFLSYDEIARNRVVCKKFNEVGSKFLSRGFLHLERRHGHIYKRVKSALPRRESERKSHKMARHIDILQGLETRISMLNMTYTKYIENKLVCFIPGKVLDELKSVLDLVETNQSPPRTHVLLQELRDLSSMAMEHFDEHILPRVKEQFDQRTGCPEKILKELEIVAGSLSPYTRFQEMVCRNVPSTSRSTRLVLQTQVQHALSDELRKVKKTTKTHKHHITYLTQNTNKLYMKLRKQAARIKQQSAKIREQERKIHEQNSKIQEQEATITEMKRHIDEWDQKYKDLINKLMRARDEILKRASSAQQSTSMPEFKSNIRPRTTHILPKSYHSVRPVDVVERKRKVALQVPSDIPTKRSRSPIVSDAANLELKIPDLANFRNEETPPQTQPATSTAIISSLLGKSFDTLRMIKPRKRKMAEDIDLK
ncbi:F-box only protein 28 [Cylas formicarius]|uniref:F-box only protein 28 n=1 Tax=Cylas formicarius TaxID=197179 RepID=UPI0029585193|nr:F-box only protein 28 [Cylas formicarius]